MDNCVFCIRAVKARSLVVQLLREPRSPADVIRPCFAISGKLKDFLLKGVSIKINILLELPQNNRQALRNVLLRKLRIKDEPRNVYGRSCMRWTA